MFDFQKEVILNNLDKVVTVNDPKSKKACGVRVDGMVYKYEYMDAFKRTEAVPAKKATITIPLSAVNTGKQQVRIELGLTNDYRSDFGSANFDYRKPVVMDFAEPVASIDDLKKAVKLVCASNNNVLVFDEAKATETAVILEAADEYISIRKAVVVTFACASESCNGDQIEVESAVVDLEPTDNVVGFGTYEYLIHNHRLPTNANWRFTSPAAAEMPVAGGMYTQFTFDYTVPRRIGGMSVVGQANKSTTVHTFYVLATEADKFAAMLTKPVDDTPEDEGSEA